MGLPQLSEGLLGLERQRPRLGVPHLCSEMIRFKIERPWCHPTVNEVSIPLVSIVPKGSRGCPPPPTVSSSYKVCFFVIGLC